MKYSAVIVAAGSGTRMKLGFNKVYAKLSDGKMILEKTMDAFLQDKDCTQVVIVTDIREYQKHIKMDFWPGAITVVKGGSTRQESVISGLSAALEDIVMIHDGARPYLTMKSLRALKKAMKEEKAACLAVPVKDTIKVTKDGYIQKTPDRETLYAAQTPQVFHTSDIIRCMRRAIEDGFTGTDDCSVFEKYSRRKIRLVTGDYGNIKITTPEDLR